MKVTDVHALVNSATTELLGDSGIVSEDLRNIVDIGEAVINLDHGYDHYVKSLINHIGKVRFVDRPYDGVVPDLMMDAWEYGSILQKIHSEMPDSVADPTYTVTNGTSYDQDVFHQPTATSKFFNMRDNFMIEHSVAYRQVKESFSNAGQLNAFLSMLVNQVNRSRSVKNDILKQRVLNAGILETVKDNDANRVINLLSLYNTATGLSLTAAEALRTSDFLRFSAMTMAKVSDLMMGISTLYNIGGTQKFTPKSEQHTIYLSDFKRSMDFYLYAGLNQFRTEGIGIAGGSVIPMWQGSGTTPTFANLSLVKGIAPSGSTEQTVNGVVAVIFDREACGVSNPSFEVLTHENAKARFINYFYHQDAGYFFDPNENFVVFIVA